MPPDRPVIWNAYASPPTRAGESPTETGQKVVPSDPRGSSSGSACRPEAGSVETHQVAPVTSDQLERSRLQRHRRRRLLHGIERNVRVSDGVGGEHLKYLGDADFRFPSIDRSAPEPTTFRETARSVGRKLALSR